MNRSIRPFLLGLGLLALGLAGACTCGGKNEKGKTEPAPAQTHVRAPLTLAPLPAAPAVTVSPDAVPGANGKLAVVVGRPTGDFKGAVRPSITFSKPMVALGTVAEQGGLASPARIEPELPGEWRWLGSATVELVPKGLVPYATSFKITVPAGLKAIDGSTLAEPFVYTFNTPRPELQNTTPYEGDRWITPDQIFTLTFNQPVKELLASVSLRANGKTFPLTLLKTVDIAEERRAEEKARHVQRESFEEAGFKNRSTRYELKPATPLPLDTPVTLTVDGKLLGAEGTLPLGTSATASFQTYPPMEILGVSTCDYGDGCGYGPLMLTTKNVVDAASLKAHLTIKPAVAIAWEQVQPDFIRNDQGTQEVALPGKFIPGVTYTFTLRAGVLDTFKQAAPAFTAQVTMRDLDPALDPGPEIALLEASGDGALPVRSVNLQSASAQLWKLSPAELARILAIRLNQYGKEAQTAVAKVLASAAPPVTVSLPVKHDRNVVSWIPLPVRGALGGGKGVLFYAQATPVPLPSDASVNPVIGQITDLAVHAKFGAKSGLVWVTSLSTGKPVAEAALSLYDADGSSPWQGKTDADGLAMLPGLATLHPSEHREPWNTNAPFAMLTAQKAGDLGVTLSSWSGSAYPSSFDLAQAWETQTAISLSSVFSERGIYRPGDEVDLAGFLRFRTMGVIKNPGADVPITLSVTDAKGKSVFKGEVKTTAFGGFSAKVPLSKDVPLGLFSVSVKAVNGKDDIGASASFRVEEYRAPQFQVDVTPEQKEVVAGDPLAASVIARYLFGGAMAGAKLHWTAARNTTDFAPPGNTGFTFGAHAWWWNDDEPEPSADIASGGEGETDAQGNFRVDMGKAAAPGGKTYAYTVEAEVTDVNRQRVANRAEIVVHPASVYAGVRNAIDGFGEVGKEIRFELVAASPDGKRQVGRALALVIKRRDWKAIKKKGVGGEWFTESEPVETQVSSCAVKSEATAVSCTYKPDQPGLYLLEATVTDEKGRTQTTRSSVYVIGSGWVSWQRSDTDRIDLVADKTSYALGDTAKILVKSPYPEADAVLTVEREGIMTHRKIHLSGAATTLEVPIDEAMVPNVYVGVVLVRGRVPTEQGVERGADPGRPATRFGYVELKVEKKSKRLSVTVTPEASEAQPRQKVKVSVKVADWKGAPTQAQVAIWAVDEGVLRLTGYQTPDPVDAMHPERGLSVRIGEPLVHLVQKQLYGTKGQSAGGGGGGDAAGGGFRSNFKTTVLFIPDAMTDASGVAHVELTLPDNLTTFRIMAIALDAGERGGSGESKVTVFKKLMALPALPRLARVGDAFEAGVVVHTKELGPVDVSVTAAAEGLTLDGPATKKIHLGDGQGHEVRFRFKAEQEGLATLRFEVSGGGERDGVEEKLPVKLPVSLEAVAAYGDTSDKRVEGLVPPGGVRPGVGGLELTLSSTVLGGFNEGMNQLVEYPYGCAEQLSSRLIPFIALREIYGKFGGSFDDSKVQAQRDQESLMSLWLGKSSLEVFNTRDPDQVVKLTVRSILQLQNDDGGFRYWPGQSCSSEWASSYAVLALSRAKEVGYPVDEGALTKGNAFLKKLAAGTCVPCMGRCDAPDDVTRTFALYTLARDGHPQPSSYEALYQRRAKLPLFSQAMLADALFVGRGDRAQARTLMGEIMNRAQETPREVHFEEINGDSYAASWSSDTRTTAIVLSTLTDVSPDHPFVSKMANYLGKVRQGSGQFRNTQEAAFSLMALAEVVRTKEKVEPDFTAQVTLGAKVVDTAKFVGRTTALDTRKLALDQLGPLDKQLPLTFSKEGPGVLYYGALLRYAPAALPLTPLDRGIVVQRWFEPFNGGGQSTTFYAGDLVRVRVRIASSQQRHYVAVDVPLPSGLEAIDTSLASTAKLPAEAESASPEPSYDYESGEDQDSDAPAVDDTSAQRRWMTDWWSPFNYVETRDDRVVLFADELPPGIQVASFVARATTPGQFILKPAQAEEMYTPEVFGRSEGGTFQVIDATQVAAK